MDDDEYLERVLSYNPATEARRLRAASEPFRQKLAAAEARRDIVYIIEVKKGNLCERGLGQVFKARDRLIESMEHGNIRKPRVIPWIVCEVITREYINPFAFQGIERIYSSGSKHEDYLRSQVLSGELDWGIGLEEAEDAARFKEIYVARMMLDVFPKGEVVGNTKLGLTRGRKVELHEDVATESHTEIDCILIANQRYTEENIGKLAEKPYSLREVNLIDY